MRKKILVLALILAMLMSTQAYAATAYYVNYSFLNVRKKASVSSKLLGKLYRNDRVSVSKISNGWAKTRYKGKTAYVCADYLSRKKSRTASAPNAAVKNGWYCKDGVWDFWKNGKYIPSAWGTHEAFTKIKGTYSGSCYKIVVNRSTCMMYIFKAGDGWEPFKQWSCSVGKPSTPTPRGNFTLDYKMKIMHSKKSTEKWAVSFYGDYCIHSTLYKKYDTSVPIDLTLGEKVSNGCIRLSESNSKWLFNNCPVGTGVYIY